MVNNGGGILQGIRLWNVLGDEFAVRIKPLGLTGRIENPEVGLGIGTRARGPLPAPVVGGKVAIEKFLHEVTLPPLPRDQEILGKEGGHDHPQPVVHPAGLVQLPHGGIHDWKAGPALAPGLKEVLAVLPLDPVVLLAEGALGDVGIFPENLFVEVAPDQFRDENVDLFLGRGIVGAGPARYGQDRPNRDCTEAKVRGEP